MAHAFPWFAASLLATAVHAHAAPSESRLGQQIQQAVLQGDVAMMNALRGTKVTLAARAKGVWRSTKGYRDIRVELTLDGQTFEGLIRIPAGLASAALKAFQASGTLSDFEPFARNGRIAWQPVFFATSLQPER